MSPEVAANKEAGRSAVAELCESFAANLDYHKSVEFDETTNRQRFIDPLFAALGWDVADRARRGPYADVVLEYSLPPEESAGTQLSLEEEEAEDQLVEQELAGGEAPAAVTVRRPDYSFRLEGVRQFFVEAKRPSVQIESPRPIFQVKSYAWSARTPLALLTDFEELLVFDCRHRPVMEEPLTGLVPEFRLAFEQYVDEWDKLWDTFSREAVLGGALVRFAEAIRERRGQLPVDRAFLADLGRWRSQLAQSFARQNPQLDVWHLDEATQLTLDRLVFIRVCEDRGLEPVELLKPLVEDPDPYPTFVRAIAPLRENYNGGLLDPALADELRVEVDVFQRVVRGLYAPWSPYRFDVLGVEILGSIYERALGSEIRLGTDRSVSVELKPEVRKAGGVYYTPQWVVEEIVRLTIDPLIRGKAPRAISNFRVLDPACGSGSFLLAAFARLIRHYEEYYSEHPTVDRRWHLEGENGTRRLTSEGKARVLARHIFGVDVDPAAVEVTMMSLYLKSLETDSPAHVRTQMQLGGAILPALDSNIRAGNSLVSTDFYAQEELSPLDDYQEHRLRPFKWESEREGFGQILEDGGFDVVIGNPPYFNVDSTYGAGHAIPAYLSRAYPEVYTDKTDIYYYFLAKAVALAKQRVGFIVSRAFLEAEKAQNVRGHLPQNSGLEHLVDFNAFQVFADAGIATAVVVFDTTHAHDESEVAVRKLETTRLDTADVVNGLRGSREPFEVFTRRCSLAGSPWRFPSPVEAALYEQIDADTQSLDEVCILGQGMQTGANSVFAGFSEEDADRLDLPRDLLKRRARNSDISGFYVRRAGPLALYLEEVPSYEDLPQSVRAYLEQPEIEGKLKNRAAYRRGDCEWWRYTWPLNKQLYNRERIVCPYRTDHNRFALDPDFSYLTLTDTTVAFPSEGVDESPFYLLGLLNTRLLTFRFRGLGKLTSANMWESFDNSISGLPIRRIDFGVDDDRMRHDRVVELAHGLEEALAGADTFRSAEERSISARRAEGLRDELDEQVLDLYGIADRTTRDEVLVRGGPLT